MIMGANTWESLPASFKPLSNRINIILTDGDRSVLKKELKAQSQVAVVCGSIDEALDYTSSHSQINEVFMIGGKGVYEEAVKRKECQ